MKKLNCWDVNRCGREPGGFRVRENGACPAAAERRLDGINGGRNAGRCCWAVAGTFCSGKPQGSLAQKLGTCLGCDFYKSVAREEGAKVVPLHVVMARLKLPT